MTDAPQPLPIETPKPRSAQDRRDAELIGKAEQEIKAALAATDLYVRLAEGGYIVDEFERAQRLQQTAQLSFAARLTADGAQTAATKAFEAADKAARKQYTALRQLARTPFLRDAAALDALGLTGRIEVDLDKFIANARAFVNNGRTDARYLDKLQRRGVTPTKLVALGEALDRLVAANIAQDTAITAVPAATAQRVADVDALKAWLTEYHAFVKVQFKDDPAARGRLLLD